jgi:hypothetical protein
VYPDSPEACCVHVVPPSVLVKMEPLLVVGLPTAQHRVIEGHVTA